MIGICQYVLFKIFLILGLEVPEVSDNPNKIAFNHSSQSWQKVKEIYFCNDLKLAFPPDQLGDSNYLLLLDFLYRDIKENQRLCFFAF